MNLGRWIQEHIDLAKSLLDEYNEAEFGYDRPYPEFKKCVEEELEGSVWDMSETVKP